MGWNKGIGEIMSVIHYFLLLTFWRIMIIAGGIVYVLLLLALTGNYFFINASIASFIILLILFLMSYVSIPQAMLYKEAEIRFWNKIKSNRNLVLFAYLTFFLSNTILLIIYMKHYNHSGTIKDRLEYFLYLPVLNIFIYYRLINKLKVVLPKYLLSDLISLFLLGRLIPMLIRNLDREVVNRL